MPQPSPTKGKPVLQSVRPLTIPEEAKRRLKIMYIAKHAKWPGGLHPEDGNHAHTVLRRPRSDFGEDLLAAHLSVR